jgi:hypothetical protein
MGLDVGVVKVAYLDRPPEPIYEFLRKLAYEAGEGSWGGAWEGNAFVEYYRAAMLSKARGYARKQHLTKDESDKLLDWVRGLPWDGNTVMLHLNW